MTKGLGVDSSPARREALLRLLETIVPVKIDAALIGKIEQLQDEAEVGTAGVS